MKCRKILIMIVLAIFIFGVASVCANDVNDTVIACGDDSAVELSQAGADEIISTDENELFGQTENVELISDGNSGTFVELQANITSAKPGSILTLTKNYEWESGFDIEGIIVDKSITIDGNGSKIDAKEKSRIFKITADNVILKNIIFTNGKTTENGGAVFFEKSGIVINCNFTNNFNVGGSVFFVGKGEITNCYLSCQTTPKSRQPMVLTAPGGQNIPLMLTVNIKSMQPMLDLTMLHSTMEL